ncbi:MAG: sensory box protein [Rhizobium sp.]|nr:sensory box protein [Rhizobium sp.]
MHQRAEASTEPSDANEDIPSWAWICGTKVLAAGYSDWHFDQEIPKILKAVCEVKALDLQLRAALYLKNDGEDGLLLAGQMNVAWTALDRRIMPPSDFLEFNTSSSAPTIRVALRNGINAFGVVLLFPHQQWQVTEERVEGLKHIALQLAVVLTTRKLKSRGHQPTPPSVPDPGKAGELLSIIVDNFPGGICVLDKNLTMVVTNRRFYELQDLPPWRFPPGSSLDDVFRFNAARGEYGEGELDHIVSNRLNHVKLFVEHSFDRETGGGLVVEARSAPLPGGGCVLTYLDVTTKRRGEQALLRDKGTLEELVKVRTEEIEHQAQELQRMLDQERQINEMQRQFASMTSHEFRTPLAIIDGAAQRLTRRKSQVTQDYISEKSALIRDAVTRMVDLMESFLAAGRLDHGKMRFEPRPCSLKDIVLRSCQRQETIGKGHRIHVQLDDLPQTLNADMAALEQVFANLLSNAVKYAPDAPDIHVLGGVEGTTAWVSVRDSGVGIDADDIPMMFQRYFRARTSTGIAGTGIGLHLVKQIIDYHGGMVTVSSRKGKETIFTVKLPLESVPANNADGTN